MTLATPPFGKIFGVMSGLSLGTRVSNLKSVGLTVLELLAFNSHDRPLRTDKQTHTSNEHIISAIHFVHLAEIKMWSVTADFCSVAADLLALGMYALMSH